jgi:hypothetical protein
VGWPFILRHIPALMIFSFLQVPSGLRVAGITTVPSSFMTAPIGACGLPGMVSSLSTLVPYPLEGAVLCSVPTCHAGQSSSVQQIYSQIDCIHHIAQETSERIFRKSRTLIISPFRDFCGERNSLLTLRACFVYRGRAPPAPQEWVSAGPVSLRSAWLVARAPVPLLEHKWGEI